MAQTQKKRPFLWVIIVLLFVGLLGFGTGGLNGTIRSIGTVGDKDINIVQYRNQLANQLRALSAQQGSVVTFQQAQAVGLDRAVLSQLVTQRTLENEATQMGLSVGDTAVRDEILGVPAFRGLDGSFSREAYTESLRREGLSEAEFETSVREGIARTLLQGAVISGVPRADLYAETLVQFAGETRDIVYATLTPEDLSAPVPGPTEADIQAYYDANGADFMAPEFRQITYVWLTPAMIQDQLEVDDTALRALYDERIDQFVQPERRLVERLVFADDATADAARARLDAGEIDFDGLVAERGLDLSDVDLGDVGRADLGDAAEAVFATEPGNVAGPAPSSLGPALFRVNAVLAAQETTFEEAAPDLREELAIQRARRVIDDAREGITDLIAGGASLEDLAERTDLELGRLDFSAESEDAIAAYDSFRAAAETAQEGAFAELLDLSDGGVFALRLDGITPPAQIPLDEVRDAVAAAWTANLTAEMLKAQAEGTAQEISPLTGFDTLGLSAVEVDRLPRTGFVEGTPPGFMAQVFEMNVTEVRVIPAGRNVLIVRLDSIAPPDPASEQTAAMIDQQAELAAAGIAQDLFDAYASAVQAKTEITLNQAAINAVHTQLQ